MGVPKFFRWLSERYPAISQLIAENRIPEFDNLYLDMNGIIHNCTHKDAGDTTFTPSEDEMFIMIFNYIEHLFNTIKPKKIFFMAIDGVAPRAKMNQQRARRFRTALDQEKAIEKAVQEGTAEPKEDRFDSNCITPGTEFMAKLTKQLKYFVNKKISEDANWRGCDVVLSGHEVPGEGEHKIMEYIRNSKAQPNYDPNVRHCLYGLDADLIMLGLVSHDPHFCLLREEVTFGRASKNKAKELEHQNFFLMHLCIVREYLELEFQDLKKDASMKFPFDMERVIDDFILMAFFVGNDFLPNLPHLHINEGALATMFRIYKLVLPRCDGYINEGGKINFERLGLLLEELAKEENRHFEHEHSDAKWLKGKQLANGHDGSATPSAKHKGKVTVTTTQKAVWKKVRKYVSKRPQTEPLDLGTDLVAADRKFIQDLADDLHIDWKTIEDDDGQRHMVLSLPSTAGDKAEDDGEQEDEEDEEGQLAIMRVMRRYDRAEVADESAEEAQAANQVKYKEKFIEWKDQYYASKFEWRPEEKVSGLRKLCENYVEGLQWVLYYYYRGVASWPWFYGYHYSPMISDISKGFDANLDFKLGQPFRPFEQLMGVLPDRSKKIVPTVYHELMTDPKSPIIDFYPRDFELDMNGKKMEWEAVVKIPFIEEKRLLDAMAPKNRLLTPEEAARNDFGVSLKFTYDTNVDFVYPSSLEGIFPDIPHCKCVENIYDLPTAEGLELYRGLLDGVKLGVDALAGFPSLATLPYNATLGHHGVSVFQQESRNESMVVTLMDTEERAKTSNTTVKLGQKCFVGYPFLQEAKIVVVSDELHDYALSPDGSGRVIQTHKNDAEGSRWNRKASAIEDFYSKRLGILIGPVDCVVHVELLKGLVKTDEGALVKEYGDIPGMETIYASQAIVDEVVSQDQRFIEKAAVPIEEEFPVGSKVFYLGEFNYGRPAEVTGHSSNRAVVMLSALKGKEDEFGRPIIKNAERLNPYVPSYQVARDLSLHPLALSKITSSFFVNTIGGMRVNLGLNLKFEARKQKVLGYARKNEKGWEFSQAAIALIANYMINFPDFFAAIKQNPQGSEFNETDLFPDPEYASKRVKEIGAWLKTVETSKFERVPLEAEQLDSMVVKQIEQMADQLFQNGVESTPKALRGIPRNALLKPQDAVQRLGKQMFALGDRVTYIQDTGKVPIGMRGTVVGITTMGNHRMLDIVFDHAFMAGSTLGERCSPFRGASVLADSVLNTSDKQVVAWTQNSLGRQQAAAGNALPYRTTTSASTGQAYRDAPAPAPLRGSWRGAAANGNHHARVGHNQQHHSGAPNLQPANLVYRPHNQGFAPGGQPNGGYQQQTNGHTSNGRGRASNWRGATGRGGGPHNQGQPALYDPNGIQAGGFEARGYNAVPPPAELTRAGGRGRGRGRGSRGARGGQPRGRGASEQ